MLKLMNEVGDRIHGFRIAGVTMPSLIPVKEIKRIKVRPPAYFPVFGPVHIRTGLSVFDPIHKRRMPIGFGTHFIHSAFVLRLRPGDAAEVAEESAWAP
jgi:hypothetical protein